MKKKTALRPLVCILLLFTSICLVAQAGAESAFVVDRLIVSLRSGKDEGARIARLRSNDPVEILEKDGRYVRVKTQEGVVGWMEGQYLTSELPKSYVIEGLKDEIKRLEGIIDEIQEEKGPLADQLETIRKESAAKRERLEKTIATLESEKAHLTAQLDDLRYSYQELEEKSARAVEIVDQFEKLTKENRELSEKSGALTLENEKLKQNTKLYWFLAGAGVFLFGWIIGKVSRRRTRSSKLSV